MQSQLGARGGSAKATGQRPGRLGRIPIKNYITWIKDGTRHDELLSLMLQLKAVLVNRNLNFLRGHHY